MKSISENIHIISKTIKEALLERNKEYFIGISNKLAQANPDWIDLNIGPSRGKLEGVMPWLIEIVQGVTDIPISLDTTNVDEIRKGLEVCKNPASCIINSANAEDTRLEAMTDLAAEYGTNLIALTMTDKGIPKTADERLELGFKILEKTTEKGILNEKILFDPLILPVMVDQTQPKEALNTIRMFSESIEPASMTTVGLSNISNGAPQQLRPLINRVFLTLAKGAGLTSAILDSLDTELLRIIDVLETSTPQKPSDTLLINLHDMTRDFSEIEEITYDKNDPEQVKIYKTAEIILNKKIYSPSYLEI